MKPYQLVHTSSQCKKHRGRDHDRASPSVRSSTSRARLAYYSLCTPLAASASTRASSITHVACLMSVPPLSDSRARSPGPRAGRHADAPPAQVPESRRVGACRVQTLCESNENLRSAQLWYVYPYRNEHMERRFSKS